MRGHTAAAGSFERELADDSENAAELRGFYLRDGGWKGDGWKQISWRRRKREEQRAQLLEEQQRRFDADERKRTTPLGRMGDDASLAVWGAIQSARFQRVITGTYTELLTFAEDAQLSHNLSSMSYEEMLAGLLYPGENLQFIPPARVKRYRKLRHDGTVLEEKGMVRCFFTDKRLFFLHTNFFQSPTMKFDRTDEEPLLKYNVMLGCTLEDNMFWTTVNLEKLIAQSVDCEYKATTHTTVVVLRPWWGAWCVGFGLLASLVLAFEQDPNIVIVTVAVAMLLLGAGAWVLLTRRQYDVLPGSVGSNRSRKLLLGLDDPVFQQLVTIDLELEEDYSCADAFEFVQGMRSVCRQLKGIVAVDSDELLDAGALMVGDGNDEIGADEGAAGGSGIKSKGAAKATPAALKDELDEAEVHKIAPPTSSKKRVDIAEEQLDERRETVAEIKQRMQAEIEERRAERLRRQTEEGLAADERVLGRNAFQDEVAGGKMVLDFAEAAGTGMGTKKKFTSRFSFMQKDEIHALDETWGGAEDGDTGAFWAQPKEAGMPKSVLDKQLG